MMDSQLNVYDNRALVTMTDGKQACTQRVQAAESISMSYLDNMYIACFAGDFHA